MLADDAAVGTTCHMGCAVTKPNTPGRLFSSFQPSLQDLEHAATFPTRFIVHLQTHCPLSAENKYIYVHSDGHLDYLRCLVLRGHFLFTYYWGSVYLWVFKMQRTSYYLLSIFLCQSFLGALVT